MKIQPEYINIHLLVVPNSTIVDDDGFFFQIGYKLHNEHTQLLNVTLNVSHIEGH